jgi:plasmid stabilization system protein ParE
VSLKVYLRPEAEADIEDAATWYDRQRKGLGQEFLDDVLVALDTISENPNIYPVVHRQSRRAVVRRFPFGIFYRVDEDSVVVLAVMHGSRHPRHWKKRT